VQGGEGARIERKHADEEERIADEKEVKKPTFGRSRQVPESQVREVG
jgi:hypothetical protein